jgi:signal transduction histidine kinase
MNAPITPSFEQLQRELDFYRREYDEMGARLVRLQEEQSRAAREARRSKIVARLVRDAYQIVHQDIFASKIGGLILAMVADTALCDKAAFLKRDPMNPENFLVEHALGGMSADALGMPAPPAFLFTASGKPPEPGASPLIGLIGVPFILWAYDEESGRGVLLGKKFEGNIHRPFEARDNEIVEVVLAVYIDLLLRKGAEAAMRQARQAAEEASNTRARFLANLSHELRSPLNTIIGFSGLLLEGRARTAPPAHRDEFARQIQAAGRSLLALANDILDFSSLGHARLQLRRDWVPVAPLLHAVARALAQDIAARGVWVDVLPLQPELQASIDYDRFRQILTNLLGNAVKFTPPGGRVEIGACLVGHGGVRFSVRDNGIGMRPEDLDRALEPFVQLKSESNEHPRGAGLGLPIAKQLVEAHDGELKLSSTYGQGTEVIILLPEGSARLA